MNNFKTIIGLMLLAMIALIGFQWYWIENAIAVKRDQFDRSVVRSMNQAVNKIEKQEVLFLAQKKAKEQEKLTLAALVEKPKPKKKRIRVPKKKQVLVNPKEPVLNLSQDPRAKKRTKQDFDSSSTLPEKQLLAKATQTNDSLKVNSLPNGLLGDLQNITFTVQLSELNQNPQLPENRLRFIKQMMREQNNIWQQLIRTEDAFGQKNKNVNEVLQLLDQEIQSFVYNESLVYDKPLTYVFERQKPEVSYNYSGDTLNVIQKALPQKAVLVEDKNAKNSKTIKAKDPKEEIQYEWVDIVEEENNSELERSKNKAALVKDVFVDFMQGKRNIYERVNQEMLDTLLLAELSNNGISLPYEYGVKNAGTMMFASYGLNFNPELANDSYKVRLFPNDALIQDQFLFVHFPEKENYIMGNMWTVFGSSMLLIFMIGGIFYSSVSTMMRQKKLSLIKNEFINNMTHEFKTPISTISLAVEVMKDKNVQANPEKYLNIIKDENSRLGSQVEKVLQMALLDKGHVKLNRTSVNIHDIIEQVGQNLSVQIEDKNGELRLDLQASKPQMLVDEVHMTNIFFNLLDNANKYSPDKPKITIATSDIVNGIKIKVIDLGKGMNNEELNNIFEKFYRVSTGNVHDVKGFGLGLSYVKKMVDLHQGNIQVNSKIGAGTTFELNFFRV